MVIGKQMGSIPIIFILERYKGSHEPLDKYNLIRTSLLLMNEWGEMRDKVSYDVQKKARELIDSFPVKLNDDITLYLIDEDVEIEHVFYKNGKPNKYKYIFNIIDNYGYKYRQDYCQITHSCVKQHPCRFFYNNPYTYDNINHYCELNNIELKVDGDGLPLSGYARGKIPFKDKNGNIISVSWNEIQHYTFRYKIGYEEVKQKKYDDRRMNREKAIPIIIDKYNELQRPLLQRDFEGVITTDTTIGIRVIWRIWGTFTNMIKDLGLPEHDYYYKPFDKNYIPHEDIMNSINDVCMQVKSEGRTVVMCADIKNVINCEISTIQRHCEIDNVTLKNVIESYGCTYKECGTGMNHIFEDGEKTGSRYEYDFSMFLRKNGFEYGKDYFRNIYYKTLDDEYNGMMNCDYLIKINGHDVYIELAGILGNKEHINGYRNNTTLKSKSKEEYRLKLNQKRSIFEKNNLEYFILLKDEMDENTYNSILKKYIENVA